MSVIMVIALSSSVSLSRVGPDDCYGLGVLIYGNSCPDAVMIVIICDWLVKQFSLFF